LRQPILYLSLFFKANRRSYYELLTAVRKTGISFPTVNACVAHLRKLGVLHEITGKRSR
jgi:Fic family protein